MNFLRFFPSFLRESYTKNMLGAGIKDFENSFNRFFILSLIGSLALSVLTYFIDWNPFYIFFLLVVFLHLFNYFRISLKASARIKKMEDVFPDVIQMMSSNLRAGMTVDKAFLLSARPEFAPLDEEILKAGKEIATGKDIALALMDMSKRILSDKITKTVRLIISGLKAGGNISILLEQTASNMREKEFVEKRATSNILMYVIFIFFAVAIGAPVLFGLSSVLVEVIIEISATVPATSSSTMNMPLSFSALDLSPSFIIYFSLIFLIVTDIISSLVLGLVNKGEEKAGLKYLLPLIAVGIAIFFIVRILMKSVLADMLPSG